MKVPTLPLFALDHLSKPAEGLIERALEPFRPQLHDQCGGAHDIDEEGGNHPPLHRLIHPLPCANLGSEPQCYSRAILSQSRVRLRTTYLGAAVPWMRRTAPSQLIFI